MALWEILTAVQALKSQVETLEAALSAEMQKADAHWCEQEAERAAVAEMQAVPF
jgi:hypothetical protein